MAKNERGYCHDRSATTNDRGDPARAQAAPGWSPLQTANRAEDCATAARCQQVLCPGRYDLCSFTGTKTYATPGHAWNPPQPPSLEEARQVYAPKAARYPRAVLLTIFIERKTTRN
jgi:hypothetical protein